MALDSGRGDNVSDEPGGDDGADAAHIGGCVRAEKRGTSRKRRRVVTMTDDEEDADADSKNSHVTRGEMRAIYHN